MTPKDIIKLGKKHRWTLDYHSVRSGKLVFTKKDKDEKDTRILVHYNTHTIDSEIFHPKSKGFTVLVRPDYTPEILDAVFINPRTHTGEGFYPNLVPDQD